MIYSYTWEQAVEDGSLAKVLPHRWEELTNGKPILMTVGIATDFSMAAVMEIWNEYVIWRKTKMMTLPEEDRMFHTYMNSRQVWVIDDGAVFTIMFPEEY